MAVFVGLAGQNLGGVLTGQGTDPGTGPLLILLAIALWPEPGDRAGQAAGRRASEEGEAEAELARPLGTSTLIQGAAPIPRPAGRGAGDAPLPGRQLPVRAVADADEDRSRAAGS